MDTYFWESITALRDAALHLTAVSEHLGAAMHEVQQATGALVRSSEAMLHAKDEHEDLRETVRRLEGLVEELLRRQNGGADQA
jgi:hypothetical protein